LQWQDLDAAKGVLSLKRGVVKNNVTELKTKASRVRFRFILPWSMHSSSSGSPVLTTKPGDWVFASLDSKGKVQLWPCGVMQNHVKPAVKAAGINKNVGWHTFRHSYATLLKGAQAKVVQQITDGKLDAADFQVDPYWTVEESAKAVSC
jgi:site-specific recombinase XerD